MPIAAPDSYPGTPGTTLYAGKASPPPGPGPGSTITTLSLVNTSGSVQAANFVSPMFGLPLRQGDVPAGEYPQFQLSDGTPCPATVFNVTSWPDGSMKFCSAFIRVPSSIPGSGTLTVNVKNGGSAPAASARTTADLTAADVIAEVVGVTNLTGTWTASLNTAITDATDIVSLGNGQAGRVWRIGGPMKQSGSAHGQLHCWHYVAALQNSSGGLLGIRYLGRVAQPWANVSSPAPGRRTVTASLKTGSTTVRALTGHDTTETVGANLGMGHYTSFFTAGTDGKWDFFQSGGSAAADCTVRVVQDKTYVIKTKQVASYNTSQASNNNASVDYRPYGRGLIDRDMAGTGEREDIGVMPGYYVRHLLTQSAVDERGVRVSGLCSGHWCQCARRSTTNQIVPVSDISATYAGLGTIQTSWRFRGAANISGFVNPGAQATLWISEYEPSHRPAAAFYPYLVTGEPQFLDLMVEHGSGMATMTIPGSMGLNTAATVTKANVFSGGTGGTRDALINGTTYKGGGILFENGLNRIPAWGLRDLCAAAAYYPDTCPWGTETRKYLREVWAANYTAANAYNAARPASWRNSGLWNFDLRDNQEAPWCLGYLSTSVCWQANVLPDSAVTSFRQHLSKYWESANAVGDIGCAIAYNAPMYNESGTRVEDMALMVFSIDSTLTFSTSNSKFTVGGTLGSWKAANNDLISFNGGTKPFAEATNYRRLYVVNATATDFQLSLTQGGAPVTVTASGTNNSFNLRVASLAPHWSAEGYTGPMTYVATITAAIRFHQACGDSNVASAATNAGARLASSGSSFNTNPRNAIATAFPA